MRATIKTTGRPLGMKNIALFALGLFAMSMAGIACTELTGPESPETPVNVTATLLTGTGGNPNLNPEYTDAVELGATRSGKYGT